MSKLKTYKGYRISKNYVKLTVWEFSYLTKSVVITHEIIPKKGLTRKQRYDEIATSLVEFIGFAPCFKPTKRAKIKKAQKYCRYCDGTGTVEGHSKNALLSSCPECKGTGYEK